MTKRIIVLASGRGSNFQAIADAIAEGRIDARVEALFSNKADAPALERARKAGIEARTVVRRSFADKEAYEAALVEAVNEHEYDLVVLAGYMLVLGPTFMKGVRAPIMNIHPSLLPSFPGLHAQRQAVEHGVKVSGCTVHFVDAGLDSGPIIGQKAVPVLDDDTEETLSSRILVEEHRLYVEAISLFCRDALEVEGRRVSITDKGVSL